MTGPGSSKTAHPERKGRILPRFAGIVVVLATLPAGRMVSAHCDSMDGPVVKAARKALESRDVNHVLIWVPQKDETAVRAAFEKTLTVRTLSEAARELADRYFFETVVRIHRAGEGAPFTGLEPAGRGFGPAISRAEEAIERGSLEPVVELLHDTVERNLRERFMRVVEARSFPAEDVEAGRDYVAAYVEFIHHVDGVYRSAAGATGHEHASRAQAEPASAPHEHRHQHGEEEHEVTTDATTPEPLRKEHEELHAQLVEATRSGGRTGEAAQEVAKRLHEHFVKEEKYALPPLGLLDALAAGKATPDMLSALEMTEKLKAELPQMLEEHRQVVSALERLSAAATQEGKDEHARFAEKLVLHAQTEEQVLYPAAILVGEYLKLRFER